MEVLMHIKRKRQSDFFALSLKYGFGFDHSIKKDSL